MELRSWDGKTTVGTLADITPHYLQQYKTMYMDTRQTT